MPHLKKVMSATAKLQHRYQDVCAKYGLDSVETQVVENSVFMDGAAIVDRNVDVAATIKALLQNSSPPVSVTMVLPCELPFKIETELIQEIVDAGAAAAFRKASETFSDVLERRRQLHFAKSQSDSVDDFSVSPSNADEPSAKSLGKYFYSRKERRALRADYKGDGNSSIAS